LSKTLSIKIPIELAGVMSEMGQLNPQYLKEFLNRELWTANRLKDHQPVGHHMTYTFKVDNDLHKVVRLKAFNEDLPVNEMVGRMIDNYYTGDNYEL